MDDIRPEYDLDYSKARRANYLEHLLRNGSNVIVLAPEVAEVFTDSETVNGALRLLIDLSRKAGIAAARRKAQPVSSAAKAGEGQA